MTAPTPELDARFSDPNAVATPWAEVRTVLDGNEIWWISTVRPDGRPHVTPIPVVWDDDALFICTGAEEQKGRNLDRNPNIVLTTGCHTYREGLDIVVEGTADRITDETVLRHLADRWKAKYDWPWIVAGGAFHHTDGSGEAIVLRVDPVKLLVFAKGTFAQTRFRF